MVLLALNFHDCNNNLLPKFHFSSKTFSEMNEIFSTMRSICSNLLLPFPFLTTLLISLQWQQIFLLLYDSTLVLLFLMSSFNNYDGIRITFDWLHILSYHRLKLFNFSRKIRACIWLVISYSRFTSLIWRIIR